MRMRPAKDTLAADVERYLALPDVRALYSYKARLSDTRAWLPALGHMNRHTITPEMIARQLHIWQQQGSSANTLRHRLNSLRQLWEKLDGEEEFNPGRQVRAPRKPRPIPRALDYFVIRTVLNQIEPSLTKGAL